MHVTSSTSAPVHQSPVKKQVEATATEEAHESAATQAQEQADKPKVEAKQPGKGDQVNMRA